MEFSDVSVCENHIHHTVIEMFIQNTHRVIAIRTSKRCLIPQFFRNGL